MTGTPLSFISTCIAVFMLTACGGAGSTSRVRGTSNSTSARYVGTNHAEPPDRTHATGGGVVAVINGIPVTREEVDQWMVALAGEDFYAVARGRAMPSGLVSEPADYAACVTNLEAAIIKDAPKAPSAPPAVLLKKCREIHGAVKMQATAYLVNAYWTIELYRKMGIAATNKDVTKLFNRIKAKQFPTEGAERQYLAKHKLTFADEMFEVKQDVLSNKIQQRIERGGAVMFTRLTEAGQRLTAATDCRPGYVVTHCKQYTGAAPSEAPSAAVLMEQLATLTGTPCINLPACGKQ